MTLAAKSLTNQIGWEELEPLNPAIQSEARAFPVDVLPEIISSAVREYQEFGQQPMALVASSALATISLCSQCHANIERAKNLCGPISLYILLQAESGERKTAADKVLSRAAREWLRKKQLDGVDKIREATAAIKAWEATEAGLLNKSKRLLNRIF